MHAHIREDLGADAVAARVHALVKAPSDAIPVREGKQHDQPRPHIADLYHGALQRCFARPRRTEQIVKEGSMAPLSKA